MCYLVDEPTFSTSLFSFGINVNSFTEIRLQHVFRGEEYPILDTFYSVPNTICKSPLPFIASKKW